MGTVTVSQVTELRPETSEARGMTTDVPSPVVKSCVLVSDLVWQLGRGARARGAGPREV